tara:strand:- start:4150 stop:4788 length:639 start_codon:yes stop_codon:yes gene_type:complete
MWALVNDSNNVTNVYGEFPSKITINNRNYDKAQLNAMSDSDKLAIKIYPVTTATQLNNNYYISNDPTYAVSGNKVVQTITKSADRKLADEDAKDEDGNQLFESDGTTKIINYGLKTTAKNKATTQANGLLKDFDWLIQRKVTADTAIPSAVVTYMAAIRTDHGNICTAIDGASDMAAFIALHTDTFKGDGSVDVVARVNRWTTDANVKQHRR